MIKIIKMNSAQKKIKKLTYQDTNIYVGSKSLMQINDLLFPHQYQHIIYFVDQNVKVKFEKNIMSELNFKNQKFKISVKYLDLAETKKNLNFSLELIEYLIQENIKRSQTLIIGVGGGVLLDIVGFVSSIYQRGNDFAYVPTTLLAMVDASIGGKNGINYEDKKNFLGTFKNPIFILNDLEFLKTLSKRDFNSGVAEIIKIAYLKNDKYLLNLLTEESNNLQEIIIQAIFHKITLIQEDFQDKGVRQYLNFGHTIGHALESYYNYQKYTHGEAVALGMLIEYPNEDLKKICRKFSLPTKIDNKKNLNYEKLFSLMLDDKKNTEINKINYITFDTHHQIVIKQLTSISELVIMFDKIEELNEINKN